MREDSRWACDTILAVALRASVASRGMGVRRRSVGVSASGIGTRSVGDGLRPATRKMLVGPTQGRSGGLGLPRSLLSRLFQARSLFSLQMLGSSFKPGWTCVVIR